MNSGLLWTVVIASAVLLLTVAYVSAEPVSHEPLLKGTNMKRELSWAVVIMSAVLLFAAPYMRAAPLSGKPLSDQQEWIGMVKTIRG